MVEGKRLKVLLVGGTGGIGKELTKSLEHYGDVVSIGSKDCNIIYWHGVQKCLETHSPDVLINLAIMSHDSLLEKLRYDRVSEQIDVNIWGNINLVQQYIKVARSKGFGRYIYISSILSENPVAGAGIYSACKAFNDNLIKTAAIENARYGISFNSIQLGYFEKGLCERLPEDISTKVLNEIPLRRFGKPEELVNLIEYFVKTPYATGTTVKLAGGL